MSVYGYRRGSIFWALILIGVGVLFLWQNFNPTLHPWQLIAKYWPVLIIFWGLSKLIDYMQAQSQPATAPPSLFSGSEVLILVLFLLLGTSVSKIVLHSWGQSGWNAGGEGLYDLFLNSYNYTQSFSQTVQDAPHLVVDAQRGDLELRGGEQSSIDVMAKETIRADNESDAKKISDNLKLEVAPEAGHYVLRSNRASMPDEGRRITVDLSLRAPKSTASEVSLERGDIAVEGLTADQTLSTQKGDVRASDIQGLVKIHKSGGSTDVRGVKGSVDLDGRGDDIEVADVSDTVTVHGEFGGALQFRNVGQTLRYESQRTDMTAQKLTGSIDMEVGSMEVKGIDGPFEVTTRQKDVTVEDFKHSVHVSNMNSQVTLETSTPPTHDIWVDSKNGDVELTLPPNSNFQIDASSNHGQVQCDFSGPALKVITDGGVPSISGSYGQGGPMIRIKADYGAIRILRTGSHPPAPPTPPTVPAPPGKSQTTSGRTHSRPFSPFVTALWSHRRDGMKN